MTAQPAILDELSKLLRAGQSSPWWRDDRAKHCAYCGIAMRQRGMKQVPTKATRDHIIPTAHGGPNVTIPACRECNEAKAEQSLPQFLSGEYFAGKRSKKHGKAWPEQQLWAAYAVATLRKTHDLMRRQPGSKAHSWQDPDTS